MMVFIKVMKSHGLTASAAIRGLRLLKIQPMAPPELLSRPCGICVVRKRAAPSPSTWIYRPIIDGNHRITTCDHHMASAVRVYSEGRTP
jgi:hypothetical protein